MAFKIKLAGIGFQVNGIYEESLKKHCGDYLDIEENSDNKKCFDNCVAGKEDLKLSDNDSVYEIIISEDDIIREQEQCWKMKDRVDLPLNIWKHWHF